MVLSPDSTLTTQRRARSIPESVSVGLDGTQKGSVQRPGSGEARGHAEGNGRRMALVACHVLLRQKPRGAAEPSQVGRVRAAARERRDHPPFGGGRPPAGPIPAASVDLPFTSQSSEATDPPGRASASASASVPLSMSRGLRARRLPALALGCGVLPVLRFACGCERFRVT
jgi:hypothetical protein